MARNKRIDIDRIFEKLLLKATTSKQRNILSLLSNNEFRLMSTTQAVKVLAVELACAESTVWDSISALKELGFVICNGRIELTQSGVLCAGILGDNNV